jgi:hypothetical protein
MKKRIEPPCSDAAVKAKTGRDWDEWCGLLDAAGAGKLNHTELAKLVGLKHGAGGWWSQAVAVGYERLRGKRALYGRSDGTFSTNTSKTLPISAAKAHAFFTERRKRIRWLEEDIVIRTATAPKSLRLTWPDATYVDVQILSKGEAKCTVAVEHSKLKSQSAVSKQKAFWKAALDKLAKAAVPLS